MIDKSTRLARCVYPCLRSASVSEPFVLLHGWGSASHSWQPLIPYLQELADVITLDLPGFGESEAIRSFDLESVIELIVRELPEPCTLVGWSLGGMLAVQIAGAYPQKISRLITLAANVKFVAHEDYTAAMDAITNRQFNEGFAADPAKTLKLFCGLLAQGDINERPLLKQLRTLIKPEDIRFNWGQALQLLADLDNRDVFSNLRLPGLHLLAEKDVLVPADAAKSMRQLNSAQKVIVLSGAAHALHWSQPNHVASLIADFLREPVVGDAQDSRDKKAVAHSFSRAAATYDSVASLQRKVGGELLDKINANSSKQIILDLGCGTGYFTPKLQSLYPDALIVGVDIAEGMLRFAQEHQPVSKRWVCADAECLPFASGSVDLIFSNFSLQWCENLPQLFTELHRVLKPAGELLFTTLGPNTLRELKIAWQAVDSHIHVNQFHQQDEIADVLSQQGFDQLEITHRPEVMEFEYLSDLTRSLKALGAHNVNRGRFTGLRGRKTLLAFKQAYENLRVNNMLPATYDVFYVKANSR